MYHKAKIDLNQIKAKSHVRYSNIFIISQLGCLDKKGSTENVELETVLFINYAI
jgi:hypothetical protein